MDKQTNALNVVSQDLRRQVRRASDGIEDLRRYARRASDRIGDLRYEAVRRGRRGLRAADHMAHEHPWQTAGAALAVGAMLGALVVLAARR